MMTGNEIRKKFLDFFASKEHLILPSASLIPEKDPSLLLIGAGMAPFKKYFTGQEKPPGPRIATAKMYPDRDLRMWADCPPPYLL